MLTENSASFEVQAAAGNPLALEMERVLAADGYPEPSAAAVVKQAAVTSSRPAVQGAPPAIRVSGKASGRQSQSPGRDAINTGGLGYVARRGVPYRTALMLRTVGGVEGLAEFQPLELMMLLADLVPEVSQAVWNFLLLGCSPGFVTLVAEQDGADGQGEEVPEGTALIQAFFEGQPQEVGDFNQQLVSNTLQLLFSGMAATEYVPGAEGSGRGTSFPIDPLTLTFRRDKATRQLVLDQKQVGPLVSVPAATAGAGNAMVPMPMNRFFWDSLHRFPDDPYGRSPFGAALTPVLDYLAFIRDLTIAFHRVGMPRYDVTYDFNASAEFVTKVQMLTDPDQIAARVKEMFQEFVTDFNALQIDDTFFHMVGTDVNVTGTGQDMPDTSGIFDIYRYRVILALKQNPVLMSFVEGSTETWADIQWQLFSNGLKAIITPAVSPLKDAAQLHCQLQGKPWKVVAKFGEVGQLNRLAAAQAEQIEIGNETEKRDQGLQSQDTTSQKLTGSKAVGEPPATLSQQEKDAKAQQKINQQNAANALKQPPQPKPAKK